MKRPYHGVLNFAWARLFMDEVFTCGHLSMVAGRIHARADEHVFEIVDALVPHEYIQGNDHGTRSERGFDWDMRVEASGKEGLLDELRFARTPISTSGMTHWPKRGIGTPRGWFISRSRMFPGGMAEILVQQYGGLEGGSVPIILARLPSHRATSGRTDAAHGFRETSC